MKPSKSLSLKSFDLLTRRRLLTLSVAGGAVVLTGCGLGDNTSKGPEDLIAWPAKQIWPEALNEVDPEIQDTYHWVSVNKDTIKWFPCTCGCIDTDNHTSNYDCYVKEEYDDGSLLLDRHAFG